MKINILGTEWELKDKTEEQEPKLETCDGYCDHTSKEIVIRILEPDKNSVSDLEYYRRKVMRHEIIHAFLFESGLHNNSEAVDAWATNEEMVDWIAFQGPKIYKVWQEANAL